VLDVTTGANPTSTGNVLVTTPHNTPAAPSGTFSDVADTDVDTGQTLTVTGSTRAARSARSRRPAITARWLINANGTYTYTLDASNSTVNALGAGQTVTDTFTYTISDGNGGTDTATLTVTIFGVNDAPDAVDDTNWVLDVTTGANPTSTGNVLVTTPHNTPAAPSGTFSDVADTDVDTGQTLTVTGINKGGTVGTVAATGTYGSLLINAKRHLHLTRSMPRTRR
jgi:VCBS repeat-containing protein